MQSNDRQLIRQLNAGSPKALRMVYDRYRTDLYTMALSLLADAELAEDCLQDVFVRLAEKARTLTIRSNLKAYLVTAVVNKARDRLRRRQRQTSSPIETLSLPAPHGDPQRPAVAAEQAAALVRGLARLPEEQREAFVLHVQGGLSFRQIGTVQAVSVRAAHSRYRYAIDKMRQYLSQEGVQP